MHRFGSVQFWNRDKMQLSCVVAGVVKKIMICLSIEMINIKLRFPKNILKRHKTPSIVTTHRSENTTRIIIPGPSHFGQTGTNIDDNRLDTIAVVTTVVG